MILIKGPEELGQYYTEKEVNPEETDENVLFKQKNWREVDAIEVSLECGSEDSYPPRSDTTTSNIVNLPRVSSSTQIEMCCICA